MTSQTSSLRERPTSTLQAAIRSPSDDGATLRRTRSVLGLYFQADLDERARLDREAEFVRALGRFPSWAMERAFDEWADNQKRRPAPADIVELAHRQVRVLQREVDARLGGSEPVARKSRMTPSEAKRVLAELGVRVNKFGAITSLNGAGSGA